MRWGLLGGAAEVSQRESLPLVVWGYGELYLHEYDTIWWKILQ